MNILGLSKATLTYFIDRGWIQHFADIYNLDRYEEEIVNAKGFGKKSYKNMIDAIEKAARQVLFRSSTLLEFRISEKVRRNSLRRSMQAIWINSWTTYLHAKISVIL